MVSRSLALALLVCRASASSCDIDSATSVSVVPRWGAAAGAELYELQYGVAGAAFTSASLTARAADLHLRQLRRRPQRRR